MEQLLILLFVLFSIFSALMERRKRRRRLEEQQRRREQPQQPQPQPQMEVEEEEEREGGWPFGGGPFELGLPGPRRAETQAEKAEGDVLAEEREALRAERRALEVERLALAAARQAQEIRPRQRVSKLVRERAAQERAAPRKTVQVGKWKLDPNRARDAIVYAEILGPPRAERRDNF